MYIFNHYEAEEASPPLAALKVVSSLSVMLRVILRLQLSQLCWRKLVCTGCLSKQTSFKSPKWDFKPLSHALFLVS